MYENHRENFGRRFQNDRDDRWRRGEERYRREVSGNWDRDDDRSSDWSRDEDNSPYYSGGYGAYGPQRNYGQEDRDRSRYYGTQSGYRSASWDRHRPQGHDEYHGRPAYGADFDRADSQQPYFTGQQSSWAVQSPRAGNRYGGYGADYRPHSYASERDNERGFFERAGDEIASWFGDEDAARRREEDHRGRGPSGYVRSDERIRDDVNDRLTDDWRIDASNVTVTVDNGEVTLGGTVSSRQAKRRAEDVAEDVSGVKHVQNNLRVAEQTASKLENNWALNRDSTAEGGTLGAKSANKV